MDADPADNFYMYYPLEFRKNMNTGSSLFTVQNILPV